LRARAHDVFEARGQSFLDTQSPSQAGAGNASRSDAGNGPREALQAGDAGRGVDWRLRFELMRAQSFGSIIGRKTAKRSYRPVAATE
jgi:hypothetical protein